METSSSYRIVSHAPLKPVEDRFDPNPVVFEETGKPTVYIYVDRVMEALVIRWLNARHLSRN